MLATKLNETQQQASGHHHQQNDSWFWEPETSSTSSKKDDNGSPYEEADIDLTSIPLETNEHELIEKLRRQLHDRETRLKVLGADNSVLVEKLKVSNAEIQDLNRNIEELDQQHQIAIEKVLDVKQSLQEKFNAAADDIKHFQQQKAELVKCHQEAIDRLDDEKSELNSQLEVKTSSHRELTEIARNYEVQIDELSEANLKFESEIAELKATVNDAPEVIVNNDDYLKKINSLVNGNFKLNITYENEDQFIDIFTQWITSTSAKIREMDFEMSKLIDENKLIKDELTKYTKERDNLKRELVNYEVECSELMKNNNILMADIESLKCGGKLETIMENDDEENIVVLERQLEDSNSLNQSLEDEFMSIRSKLEATEVERVEYFDEIQQLKTQLTENISRCKEYQQEIENLENEKSNYLFELHELKSEEERNILQKELKMYKDREVELTEKLTRLEKEHAMLHEKYQSLESQTASQIKDLSTSQNQEVEETSKILNEKDFRLKEVLSEVERLRSVKDELSELEKIKIELMMELDQIRQSLLQANQDKELLESKCEELEKTSAANIENLKKSNDLVQDLQKRLLETNSIEEMNAKIATLEETLASSMKEKENLIGLVTTKHNENVQYHNEIIRLNQLLQQETQKAENSHAESVESLNDEITFLREKCDLLAQNLIQEQNNLRSVQQEKQEAIETNNSLNKDIERLRQHLLEVADAYTFEQVSLQKQVEEYKSKLMAIEAEAKHSATAYTSANIRANQQAETLQTQYNLLAQQRDELLAKLSAAEDIDNKNQAALTNLQVALEIFQKDKERDIEAKTATIQKELDDEKVKQVRLANEIQNLQQQLQEAKNGLMAAARLSDQMELNQHTIERLNNEIASYQNTNQSLKRQLEESNANISNADVDLIKNLVMGYITAPNANAKTQILKLIANVLHLNDAECTRIGLNSGGTGVGGWFSRGSSDKVNNNVSLTEAFVAFLEKESQPRINANLLAIHENETTTPSSRKTSTSGNVQVTTQPPNQSSESDATTPVPILLGENSLLAPYSNRNSSTILKDLLHDT
ncbi:CLUMA_CG019087, isoform A [Clunio marinus]|uniref:CLUMA_CG019087, isoform A n=1 Tax=Clunio marinus TaxID=568069 RepID=A0A1J1J193_9DIPT|nr:CLUMA_CG019087, isoform A [Clunio marinus]